MPLMWIGIAIIAALIGGMIGFWIARKNETFKQLYNTLFSTIAGQRARIHPNFHNLWYVNKQ